MVFHSKPDGFNHNFEVVSCFLEHSKDILLLQRQSHKTTPNVWGIPAGKVNHNEDLVEALYREIYEETQLELSESKLKYFDTVFIIYPTIQFVYHMYFYKLDRKPKIAINKEEHQDHMWTTPHKALDLELIPDEDYCIKYFYKI